MRRSPVRAPAPHSIASPRRARCSSMNWPKRRICCARRSEQALAELVALGLATSDSFAGLRALLVPSGQRKPLGGATAARPGARRSAWRAAGAGRWSAAPLDRRRRAGENGGGRACGADAAAALRRGVLSPAGARGGLAAAVARSVARLSPAGGARRNSRRPLRRRIFGRAICLARSGRAVARDAQEAAARTNGCRCRRPTRSISIGILTPGPRLAALTGNRVVYRDGLPVATLAGGKMEFLADLDGADRWRGGETADALRRARRRWPTSPDAVTAHLHRSAATLVTTFAACGKLGFSARFVLGCLETKPSN